MGVGSDERVGIGERLSVTLLRNHYAREALEVHLVHYSGAGRHHPEIVEGVLGPLEKRVSLPVSFVFDFHVLRVGVAACEVVDLHGVVYDEVHGHYRVYERRVPALFVDDRPHGREVHDAGNPREVLEYHPGGIVGNFARVLVLRVPLGKRPHVLLGHDFAVEVTKNVFKQYSYRKGKPGDRNAVFGLELRKGIYPVASVSDPEVGKRIEVVPDSHLFSLLMIPRLSGTGENYFTERERKLNRTHVSVTSRSREIIRQDEKPDDTIFFFIADGIQIMDSTFT